jgi:8-oxo-dGTP diphosphatase
VAVAVDVVALSLRAGRLAVLLVRRPAPPQAGALALPGTFLRPDVSGAWPDLRDMARTALAAKTGLAESHLEQLASYGGPGRDPRMMVVSVAYLAFGPDLPEPGAGTDAAWFALDDLPRDREGRPVLAFDHGTILAAGLARARAKLEYTTLASHFLPPTFTIAELRRVYEIVWGRTLDAGNFHHKMIGAKRFLVATGQTRDRAQLYRAATDQEELYPPLRQGAAEAKPVAARTPNDQVLEVALGTSRLWSPGDAQQEIQLARATIRILGYGGESALTWDEVARRLGLSRGGVWQRQHARSLLALPVGPRRLLYPAWQFDPMHPERVLPALAEVLAAMPVADPWGLAGLLIHPQSSFGGRVPLEDLRDGDQRAARAVVGLRQLIAAAYGEGPNPWRVER